MGWTPTTSMAIRSTIEMRTYGPAIHRRIRPTNARKLPTHQDSKAWIIASTVENGERGFDTKRNSRTSVCLILKSMLPELTMQRPENFRESTLRPTFLQNYKRIAAGWRNPSPRTVLSKLNEDDIVDALGLASANDSRWSNMRISFTSLVNQTQAYVLNAARLAHRCENDAEAVTITAACPLWIQFRRW